MKPSDSYRKAWTIAADFPADKEAVYPEHAQAQEFDRHQWGGKRVLEYGCGGGSDAMSYMRRGCHVIYVDISKENVERARNHIRGAGLEERGNGLVLLENDRIPLVSDFFDVVSSHGVLHHIEDPSPVLRELVRVLRPGGELYCMLYTEHLYRKSQEAKVENFCRFTDGIDAYARAYTEGEGTKLLFDAGLTRVRVTKMYADGDFRTFVGVKPS